MLIPRPKGLVLALRSLILTRDGCWWESTATSSWHIDGEAVPRSRVNSPALMKPNYPKQHAAHSNLASTTLADILAHITCKPFIIVAVIGNRFCEELAWPLAIPFNVYCRRGHSTCWGGGRPDETWRCLSADRYEKIDCTFKPWCAKKAANRHTAEA